MPLDDDAPRLSEIARTIADFRSEFRDAIGNMVRRDVYDAHRQTTEVKITAIEAELRRTQADAEKDQAARATMKNIMIGALLSGIVSLTVSIILVVVQ